MAKLIELQSHQDSRGVITVVEQILPFPIKRIYYMYAMDGSKRGGHRHRKTSQAIICLQGSCSIYCHDGMKEQLISLDNPRKCLILQPADWHRIENVTGQAIVMVLASEEYSAEDYINEPYA